MVEKTVFIIIFVILSLAILSLITSHQAITQTTSTVNKSSVTIIPKIRNYMTITSSAFAANQSIPSKYTCDGQSINPPLAFSGIPEKAKSLVLLMDDPDVPKSLLPSGVFDHWVIYNINPSVTEISENSIPPGAQGLNGAGSEKYYGPCPPDREHRYFFKLYALDDMLNFSDPAKVTKQMVIGAMQGHIMEQAELIGLYNRPQNQK